MHLSWWLALALFASTGKVITFDSEPLGKTPAGWTVATAQGITSKWEIRKDQSAPTQPYVFAQVSSSAAEGHAPLAILNNPMLRDGDVSVRLKPVSGHEGTGGGLIWRYRDENNYYLVQANTVSNRVAIHKIENGRRVAVLAEAKHQFPVNDWRILKVSARGNRFQVYVDHRRILSVEDGTFPQQGKVGLWTAADSVTYFDDFRVYPK